MSLCWVALREYHDMTDDHQGKVNTFALIAVLNSVFSSSIDEHSRLRKSGKTSFSSLEAVFCPGEIMLACDGEAISAYRLTSFTLKYAGHVAKQYYAAITEYIDWNVTRFGYANKDVMIPQYDGEPLVSTLPVYPAKWEAGYQTSLNRVMGRVHFAPRIYQEIRGSSHVFRSLVLQGDKETALSLVKRKNAADGWACLLLFGPTGVGELLATEAVGGLGRFDISAIALAKLAEAQVNGREIQNLVKNALIMDVEKGGKVGFGDPTRLVDMCFRAQRQLSA
ncbi:hypothetical protein DL768_006745 [Monosporascus sp. mg162]|nr:hypothetical protein DL768_006745 [Monosporascus sp. mg162]